MEIMIMGDSMVHKMNDQIILVNEQDKEIGYGEKLQVHRKELLHRAFSIFIFDRTNQTMLLQKRAAGKYHSGGLWTNACCSHPRKGETMEDCLSGRVKEELGFDAHFHIVDPTDCVGIPEDGDVIYRCGSFRYFAGFEELSEHEIDHVFLYCPRERQFTETDFTVNPEEAETVRWVPVEEVKTWLRDAPEEFTAWFARAFALACAVLEKL